MKPDRAPTVLLAALTLSAGLVYACGGEGRGDPKGSAVTTPSGTASSGSSSSSGSGGAGGDAGAGGSTSATGGSGGSGSCDGTASCETCIQCAVNSPCVAAYLSCVNELACDQALLCLSDCGSQCAGDQGCYAACEDECSSTQVGHQDAAAVLDCICHVECVVDCGPYAATDCTLFI